MAVSLVLGMGFSSQAISNYVTDTKSGCKVWARVNGHNVSIMDYTGDCKDGYAHGKGTVIWSFQGGKGNYTGDFNNGKIHGIGKANYVEGGSDYGTWHEGVFRAIKACGSRSYDEKEGITAEDFGNCNKIGTDDFVGLTLFKQNGKYFDLQCRNGSKRDYRTTGENLVYNFKGDKCWEALHLIPNSCELDDYRGQCNANKEPDGVGYQKHKYRVDGKYNHQIYRGMFKNGQRSGHGSYYELRDCNFLGCGGYRTSGSAWFKDNKHSYDCTWNYKECESKPAREAEQARKEQEAYDRKVAAFRKNLQVGDDAKQGMVIEIKGNLIKIQTNDSQCTQRDYKGNCENWMNTPVEKWVKRSELYPD